MALITVVDNQTEFLDLVREILEANGHGVTCLTAADADPASLFASRPELLIVDLRFEASGDGMGGWEIVLFARADAELRDVPVLVCSADHPAIHERARDVGTLRGVHVLLKPFSLDDFEEAVRSTLRRAPVVGGPRATPPDSASLAEEAR